MFNVSLEKKGYTIIHIRGNGDTESDSTVASAKNVNTVLVGDDTDIFNLVELPWGCFSKGPIA